MKKLLFTLCAATLSTMMVTAQTRLSLYEEFSGENCGPCALYNPGLWTLLSGNTSKIMLIKYQCPIPSAGPIYNAYKTISDARRSYYGVTSAPYGIQNGNEVKGNIATYSQASIDASVANPAPFALSATHAWFANDSITANITISTPAAYTATGANLKVRVALIEHLSYCAAPGSNGETEFHNVVREMYPDAAGTSISNTWTASQTQTITLTGKVPTMVDKSNNDAILVVWIQNDIDKHIFQAATSAKVALPVDGALTGCVAPVLACAAGSASVPTSATLTNTGAATLTSATIYYKLDNGTLTSTPWTGSLAPGGSTTVSIPALTMTPGAHVVYDSVALPNGSADVNLINNVKKVNVTVRDASPVTMPVSTDFETAGAIPTNWTFFDVDGNGANWLLRPMAAHNGSSYALMHRNYLYAPGEVNYALLPNATMPTGSSALDFYMAYAQYSNENDELAVVYTTDCGATWTTVWSAAGAALATHDPVGNNVEFMPTDADWRLKSIDMSAVPANATIAFRATSAYGNNLYIDDVNLRAGAPTAIRNVAAAAQEVSLYPNPAKESATLSFTLATNGKVSVSVLDAVGRTVAVVADASMQKGKQQVVIPTSNLATGVYNIAIRTAEGVSSQRLSVVK